MTQQPHIVIVGAGFGGLWAARALAKAPVRVTLYDRNNFHTFLPLLYQVAAAELEAEQIAYPVRAILRELRNVEFVMADVTAVDPARQVITVSGREVAYDYLILAMGSTNHFFNVAGAATHAFPLKSMSEALNLRQQLLACFEAATQEADPARRRELLTFVVVGGGPTGVEYVGALAALVYGPFARDYPGLDLGDVQVILVEAAGRLLGGLPEKLGDYARERLQRQRVSVQMETVVSRVTPAGVQFSDGRYVPTRTVIWTAGVQGERLAGWDSLVLHGPGRVAVQPTLQAQNHSNIYVVGDLAALEQAGAMLPMLAPVATQQGRHAAENILNQINGQPLLPFRYKDRGSMATIGRNAGVASIAGRAITGYLAWIIWLAVHLYNLIGFRNRLVVLINWAWSYLFFDRVVRLIMPAPRTRTLDQPANATPMPSPAGDGDAANELRPIPPIAPSSSE